MKRRPKITKPLTRAECARAIAEQFRPPFRGEIYQFFQHAPMGRRFANEGEPFDIETACYLKEPMQTIRTRQFGKFVGMAAVQTLKTHGLIEQPAGFFMFNDPGDTLIFVTGDESADDQAKGRTMNFWKGQKDLAKLFADVAAASSTGRHDIGTYELYLPGMVLGIWPMNIASTQRNTIRYVFITDAFLCERTGLIDQAIARTSQHNSNRVRDYKIVIESQGGETGDDFDKQWLTTDGRRLNVKCPACGTGQEFVWHRKRGEDFTPVPPLDIPSLDHAGWTSEFRPKLVSADGCHAGMKRGDAAVKRSDGSYDADEVRRQTHYECFHCGSKWLDIPRVRLEIDRSSFYVPSITGNPPENIGWWWPKWAGQRLSWGDAMLGYLSAKRAQSQGNIEDIKQWHQKTEARPWSMEILQPEIKTVIASYDPNAVMENELCRIMGVDVQQDQDHMDKHGASIPGWFWYEAVVVDKFGNARQLARGHCTSWEAWIEVQKKWKIPNDYVGIDIGKWPQQVMLRAAAEREQIEVQSAIPWERFRVKTWLLLAGDDMRTFGKHKDGKYRPYAPDQPISVPVVDNDGRRKMVTLKKVRWANVPFKLQLDAIRSGAPGMPRYEVLPREALDAHTQEMERGVSTYEMQMASEMYEASKGKDAYHPTAANRPNHYRDARMMAMVIMARLGLLGHMAAGTMEVPK